MHKRYGIQSLVWTAVAALIVGTSFGIYWPEVAENFERKNSNSASLPEDLDVTELQKVYDVLRKEYDGELDIQALIDGAKAGLASGVGDAYTVYLNDKAAKEFQDSLDGTFSGIGAEIAVKDNLLQVVSPLSGSPAEKAGLRPGEPIIAIDGDSTEGITVEEAVTIIRGEQGTDVVLTIVRNNKPLEVTITRDVITIPSIKITKLSGGIAHIELSRFGDDTTNLLVAEAQKLVTDGFDKIILDLRNNPGGLLAEAISVGGLWIDDDVVVQQRVSGGSMQPMYANKGAIFKNAETIVLINGGSASASEIVAGALQDYKLATVVGTQSFGKGSVQSLEKIGSQSLLKVTIARWFTPKGGTIDKTGITPDNVVELSEADFEADRDPQLKRAIELLSN